MKVFTQAELKTILELHQKWLRDEDGGERANLSYANLSYANLSSANLSYANLSSANLSYANLSSANLSSANLSYANLSYANLSYAVGNGRELKTIIFSEYIVTAAEDGRVWGGCTEKTIDEWLEFEGLNEDEDDKKYLETVTKPFLRMIKEME